MMLKNKEGKEYMKVYCESKELFEDFCDQVKEKWDIPLCFLALESKPDHYPCIIYFTEIIDFKKRYLLCMFAYESDFKDRNKD